MARASQENFIKLKEVVGDEYYGIQTFGLLHQIADAFGWDKINTGTKLHFIWKRVIKLSRELIKEGYPIKEYRIKCCSWTPKETWHPMFRIEEKEDGKPSRD